MWDAPLSTTRSFGTYRWQVSLTATKWWSTTEDCVGHSLTSPYFPLCGYLWALTIYPKGRKADPHEADLFLACIGTKPEDAIKFQLWVHNHPSVQKSIKSDGSRFFKGNSHGFGFMSPENLFRPENGFMQGQKLAVGVHISAIEPGSKEQQPVQESPSLFGPFFDNCSTSDIVSKAGEATIHAHKIVLSAHSSLFRAMFQTGTKESTAQVVTMSEIEGSTLIALIHVWASRHYPKRHTAATVHSC
ncbi:TPA: hypothetical protein ACH3X2_009860 [Trebouxia sp. C0005]